MLAFKCLFSSIPDDIAGLARWAGPAALGNCAGRVAAHVVVWQNLPKFGKRRTIAS
jgi:hypothetical protein